LVNVLPEWESGFFVIELDPDGPAADAGIKPGCIITRMGDVPIRDADDVRAFLKAAVVGKSYDVVFFQYSDDSSSWTKEDAKIVGRAPAITVPATKPEITAAATKPSSHRHTVHQATPQDFDDFCKEFVLAWNEEHNNEMTDDGRTFKTVYEGSITSTDVRKTDSIAHPIVGVLALHAQEEFGDLHGASITTTYSITVTFAIEGGRWKAIKGTQRVDSKEGTEQRSSDLVGIEVEQNAIQFSYATDAAQ
jgi:membrane-associated protease RseP (regulator of RpoE activity)